MDDYLPRLADQELSERLSRSGAVVIRGAKWCGRTETALQQSKSALFLQDPDLHESNMIAAQTKPSLLLEGSAGLIKLADKIDRSIMGSPSFLMVIAPTRYAHRRPDGVFVAPLSCVTV